MPKAERQLIRDIQRTAARTANPAVVRGIGDDSAVLKLAPEHQLLVTTDLCVENVHFRRAWHPAKSVGHRCLTRGLSDIAAMGGLALSCFLSLALPDDLPQSWVKGFVAGLERLARRHQVALAGGDISSAQQIVADIIVVGRIPAGKAVLRSGARPGDRIYVTGDLGGSGAVLRDLYAGRQVRASASSRHFFPEPRLQAGRWLREHGLASSMIDVSDGLSIDLLHICADSHVDAVIDADRIPLSPGASLQLAFDSGDDYELIFTAPPRLKVPGKIDGIAITEIGMIGRRSTSPTVRLRDIEGETRPLRPAGWQHFGKK